VILRAEGLDEALLGLVERQVARVADGLRDQIFARARRAHDQRRNVGHVPVNAVAIASQVVCEYGMPGFRPQLGDRPRNPEQVAKNVMKSAANLEEERKRRSGSHARRW
jgi:hypothetical protein